MCLGTGPRVRPEDGPGLGARSDPDDHNPARCLVIDFEPGSHANRQIRIRRKTDSATRRYCLNPTLLWSFIVTLVDKLLILAMAAQVLLTIGLLVWMGRERVPRVMRGEIPVADIAVDRSAYPLKARLLSNSFDNQFQLPMLFFVAALLALQWNMVGWVEVLLAWLFVALRYVHAAIHVTSNRVHRRFAAYSAGLAVLALFWLWLVLRILLLPSI